LLSWQSGLQWPHVKVKALPAPFARVRARGGRLQLHQSWQPRIHPRQRLDAVAKPAVSGFVGGDRALPASERGIYAASSHALASRTEFFKSATISEVEAA
jgi:hypothetical protein